MFDVPIHVPVRVGRRKSLPEEGEIYVQQLDKQVNQIYNPDTDGKIYNPATDAPTIKFYRNTRGAEPKHVLPLQERINRYIKHKTFWATLYIILFFVGFSCLYSERHYKYILREQQFSSVQRYNIAVHFCTWWYLFRGVTWTISIMLLYCGDKNADKKLLKAFLIVGRLSYSFSDYYAGVFGMVRRRILEIGSKQAGNLPQIHNPLILFLPYSQYLDNDLCF